MYQHVASSRNTGILRYSETIISCPSGVAATAEAYTAVQLSRDSNLHRMPSLLAARAMAPRATRSEQPFNSKITRPGFTTATQVSGFPLPLPIRVSKGFLDIGLSGNIRIQTCPRRCMWRVSAIRAASICWLVIHPLPSTCSPKSPKSSLLFLSDLPARLPL